MIWLVICAFILAGVNWFLNRRSYKDGYAQGHEDMKKRADEILAEEMKKIPWVYEDSLNPMWRHNKKTGETQKRYTKPSSLAVEATQGPKFSDWRTVVANKVTLDKVV